MSDEPKKRGRPKKILTPEETEAKRIARNKRDNERQRANGYAAQKKYNAAHRQQENARKASYRRYIYEPRIRIPMEKKEALRSLLEETGLTLTQIVTTLIEEKYHVDLSEGIDEPKKK